MVEVYIYDAELNPIYVTDAVSSLIWTRRYFASGEFELHVPLTQEILEVFTIGNVVRLYGDDEAGIIENRTLSQNESGTEEIAVTGKFISGLLGRRIIWGRETLRSRAEYAMRKVIEKNAVNPDNPDRVIPYFVLGAEKGYTERVGFQTSYSNLLDTVEDIARISGLGFKTVFDYANKQFVFEVFRGLDRTFGQMVNPPAVFSTEFENVFTQEYVEGVGNYRNVTLVAGEGEGLERTITVVGEGVGLDRFEMFVDARDLRSKDEEGNQIGEELYISILQTRGLSKMAECQRIQTFDATINTVGAGFVYREDFDVGDVVTIANNRWGVMMNTRIIEVQEVYEPNNYHVYATFGNKVPTLIDKIKQGVR